MSNMYPEKYILKQGITADQLKEWVLPYDSIN